jgi:pimeloyl-ACP methyl ester carboxylesterase
VTRRAIDAASEPVILVGHSYGGAVITEAGTHPKVAGLVYIAAFVPDTGESVNTLIPRVPEGRAAAADPAAAGGIPSLDREKFHAAFAGDLSAEQAAFMADSQVPWGVGALGGAISDAAWQTKPSWYLITTEDRRIPPPAQRTMSSRAGATVSEAAGSHAIYVSQPAVSRRAHPAGDCGSASTRRRVADPVPGTVTRGVTVPGTRPRDPRGYSSRPAAQSMV